MTRKKATIDDINAEAANASTEPVRVTPVRWACIANGCPAFAAISHGERMVCGYHADVRNDRWSSITTKLREQRWLVDAIRKISSHEYTSTTENWADILTQQCLENDRDDLMPGESTNRAGRTVDERRHPMLWAQRANGWLVQYVTDDTVDDREKTLSRREHFIAIGQALAATRGQE